MAEPLQIAPIAIELGMTQRGRNRWGPCPACKEATLRREKRGPVLFRSDGLGWRCYSCNTTGDTYDLVGHALGIGPARTNFREVTTWLRERRQLLDHHVPAPSDAAPKHAPARTILEALRACTPVAELAEGERPDLDAFLDRRRYPRSIPAGVLPRGFSAPWWPPFFTQHWQLVVAAYDPSGHPRAMHGRALGLDAPRKTTWPKELDCRGLFFADPWVMRPFLRGGPPPSRVLIAEGITDYLAAAAHLRGRMAVIGIESGSIPALADVGWPDDVRFYDGCDPDEAGEAYSQQLANVLAPHPVYRLPLHKARAGPVAA